MNKTHTDRVTSDRLLIDRLGGPSKIAEMLGYHKIGGVQRVQNWRVRGIPSAVKVDHPDLFLVAATPHTQTSQGAEQGVSHA